MELLVPAKDFNTAKIALYSGADAIYIGVKKFSARAYAVNLSLDEVKELVILAHTIDKKIYVTVNTIIKENELEDAYKLLDDLYLIDVDGIIVTDMALITYIIKSLPKMEVHISTQSGVKYLNDALFFEKLGAKRCVIAREIPIQDIKKIKNNTKIELEVFIHGALCVSYSGGCLFSSLLSLRSGNRGRCSQNCRREYELYEDNVKIENYANLLSMKDLNSSSSLKQLIDLKIDSFKIEGRMKDPFYVSTLTKFYRNIIDGKEIDSNSLDKIFHRPYTRGFLFNEDNGYIVDINKRTNEGELVGYILNKEKNLTKVKFNIEIKIGDRIKIDSETPYYFNIDEIYNDKFKKVNKTSGISYLNLFKKFDAKTKIYRMKDENNVVSIDNTYKYPLDLEIFGKENEPLKILTKYKNRYFSVKSDVVLQKSISSAISVDVLKDKLSRLNDTSFYLNNINYNLDDNLFIPLGVINKLRQELINNIYEFIKEKREILRNDGIKFLNYEDEKPLITVSCKNIEQYRAAKDAGIKYAYYNDVINYVGKDNLNHIDDFCLIKSYGGFLNKNYKELIADYTLNVINSKALYDLHNLGAKYVTLSVETSFNELKNIYNGYKKYGNNPNIEYVVYGKYELMKLKYCPLKRYNKCGTCNEHKYYIKDKFDKFPLLHENCTTYILNSRPLDLIDELKDISSYSKRLRINLEDENYEEAKSIIARFQDKLNNLEKETRLFDGSKETKGYFKREIE